MRDPQVSPNPGNGFRPEWSEASPKLAPKAARRLVPSEFL